MLNLAGQMDCELDIFDFFLRFLVFPDIEKDKCLGHLYITRSDDDIAVFRVERLDTSVRDLVKTYAVPADINENLVSRQIRQIIARSGLYFRLFAQEEIEIAVCGQFGPIEDDFLLLGIFGRVGKIGDISGEYFLMEAVVDLPHEGMLLQPGFLIGILRRPNPTIRYER
jgi:hypothetical protein